MEERLHAVIRDMPFRTMLATNGPDGEAAMSLIQRQGKVLDEIMVLEDLFLMSPLARARRKVHDSE